MVVGGMGHKGQAQGWLRWDLGLALGWAGCGNQPTFLPPEGPAEKTYVWFVCVVSSHSLLHSVFLELSPPPTALPLGTLVFPTPYFCGGC